MDIGSFECVTSPIDKSTRDIFIYWQNIDDNEKCGDLFEYRAYYTSITADNKTMLVSIIYLFIYLLKFMYEYVSVFFLKERLIFTDINVTNTIFFYLKKKQNRIHRSFETHKNYAKFEMLNTSIGYNFTVYSANKEGLSADFSTIYVPSESDSKSIIHLKLIRYTVAVLI